MASPSHVDGSMMDWQSYLEELERITSQAGVNRALLPKFQISALTILVIFLAHFTQEDHPLKTQEMQSLGEKEEKNNHQYLSFPSSKSLFPSKAVLS